MRIILILLCCTVFVACGGVAGDPSATRVSLYKYSGSIQCTGGGKSLAEMKRQLTDAGIPVLASSCGADGRVYAAMCGGADGRIGIFEISAKHSQAASVLGFAPLSKLPDATPIACP